MEEILLIMVLLFAAYLFLPKAWLAKLGFYRDANKVAGNSIQFGGIPEDSVLRRHYITKLRSEIEMGLFPRPTDSTLQRHYDTLVATELEQRLVSLKA